MSKTWFVLQHELGATLRRRSFLAASFGLPLLIILVFAGITIARVRSAESGSGAAEPPPFEFAVEGYVDHSGLIRVVPEDIPPDHLVAFPDEVQAGQALASGEISAYYIIPADYVLAGEIFYVYPDTTALTADGQAWLMRRVLLENLLGGDAGLADRVWNPIALEMTNLSAGSQGGTVGGEDCSRPGFACQSSPLVRYLPALVVALFYASFMLNANLLLESVGTEKENRTIEILLLSVSPRQLLSGKIIGLGIAALMHIVAWVGTIYALFSLGGQTLKLPANFRFPPAVLGWGIVFFLLGFAIYASLMAGVGALAPKLKEGSQASSVVLMPLMIGYVVGFLSPMAEASQKALPLALSLFPLTAPVVMIMRLTDGNVPLWQLLLSVGLMVGAAAVVVHTVAAMFHAQHLLSGESFSLKRYLRALLGGAQQQRKDAREGA